MRNWGGESLRSDAKNCFYPIIVNPKTKEIEGFGNVCPDEFTTSNRAIENDGKILVYPVDSKGVERKWRYSRQSVGSIRQHLRARMKNGEWDIEIGKNFEQYRTVWIDPRYDANEYGTKIVKDLVPDSKFSFPKSLWNIYDCIYAVVGDDKDAIVLDYHAGSGTTAHALLEINKKDDGNRKFILSEQMDYVESVTSKRVQAVLKRDKIENDFIYIELAENNESAKNELKACESLDEILELVQDFEQKYFLHYNVRFKEFIENTVQEENFRKLKLGKQKEMFCRMLDLNQLYVNASEMEDKRYGLDKKDIELTKDFYQIKE